ncbi:MAG: hypothetical protein ACUZ8H_04530 [Candidatus Anammoxibacter sp.]
MKIKVNITALILTAFILTISYKGYSDISMDDMGFLLEEEVVGKQDNDEPEIKKTLNVHAIAPVKEEVRKGKLTIGYVLDKASELLHRNIVIVIAVGGCCLFFMAVLYIFYVKIKTLSEQAQVSKDLAEKYFYNIQEQRKERVKIDEIADAKASEINTEISDIISSVEKAFDVDTKETATPDEELDKMFAAANGVAGGDLALKRGKTPVVNKENIDIKESIVDRNVLNDEGKTDEATSGKQFELEIPEASLFDNINDLDILKTTEEQEQNVIDNISKVADSADKDTSVKETISDQKEQGNEVKDAVKEIKEVVKVPEKQAVTEPPETAVTEPDSIPGNLDIPKTAEEQTVNSPNTTEATDKKDNKGNEPVDAAEPIPAAGVLEDDGNAGKPEKPAFKEKKEPVNTNAAEHDDVSLDIDDILQMETDDDKTGKK